MVPTFSILFISDLHIGGNPDAGKILQNLAQKTASDSKEDKTQAVDFLVIAGDIVKYYKGITNDGRIEQYKAADTVIHKLCTTCKIDEQNVVIVPGNHDSDVDLSRQEKKVKFFNLNSADCGAFLRESGLMGCPSGHVRESPMFLMSRAEI